MNWNEMNLYQCVCYKNIKHYFNSKPIKEKNGILNILNKTIYLNDSQNITHNCKRNQFYFNIAEIQYKKNQEFRTLLKNSPIVHYNLTDTHIYFKQYINNTNYIGFSKNVHLDNILWTNIFKSGKRIGKNKYIASHKYIFKHCHLNWRLWVIKNITSINKERGSYIIPYANKTTMLERNHKTPIENKIQSNLIFIPHNKIIKSNSYLLKYLLSHEKYLDPDYEIESNINNKYKNIEIFNSLNYYNTTLI